MSILNDLVRDVASLLFPPRCAVCGEPLTRGERTVCTLCRATAPLTGYWREADNPVVRRCWGMVPVCQASGFLFFVRASGWRWLIHGFKYRGAWRTAREMGAWYGRYLRESGLYDDVEVVVPLPLHPFKRCRRGYNQSEYIAEGIAAQLGVEVDRRSVSRARNTASQALKPRRERAGNVEDAFAVCRPERLAGRHVLLVDDVMTTGSTLLSCASAILRDAPGCRISIAALAVSQRELGVKEYAAIRKLINRTLFRPQAVNPFRERGLGQDRPRNAAARRGPASGPFRHSVAEAVL